MVHCQIFHGSAKSKQHRDSTEKSGFFNYFFAGLFTVRVAVEETCARRTVAQMPSLWTRVGLLTNPWQLGNNYYLFPTQTSCRRLDSALAQIVIDIIANLGGPMHQP